MTTKKFYHKLLSVLLCLAMVISYIPPMVAAAADTGSTLNYVANSKIADPSTLNNWTNYFGPDKMTTEFSGAVWTDKSVFASATSDLPGVSLTDSDNFLVALSAIAADHSIKGHSSVPTDTMLVLDVSGSMVDGTTEVGYVRRGNNYRQAQAIDMSLINAMVEATNATIQSLMEQNTNNRVGVVLYSGNTSTNQDADYGDATVVLPLGRYAGVNEKFLTVDAETTTSQLYTYNQATRRWTSAGTSDPYVAEDTPVYIETVSNLETAAGAAVSAASKRVNGGTYIQNGLYKALEEFRKVTDTTVPQGAAQEGTERMPVIVLMSDGAPTIATTNYTDTKTNDSNTGNGGSTNNRITFLTQLTAAYVRGEVAAHYRENANDEKEALFLTLGLGTENSTAATDTLYPAGSDEPLTTYWSNYLAATSGSNVNVGDNLTVARNASVAAMNYVDKYFYATNAQGLVDSFEDILGEIELKAESYTTLVEGGNADLSGYVTFEDELGELMQVYNVSGILLGNTLLTGKELAKGMTDGNLGTVTQPNARGDELVTTVKERIPGTTTTQAQQLIHNAYVDQQLYFTDDNHWSNYIGWYSDTNGNYAGFWDKDSGYANAPAGATHANKSYGYLGVSGESDMMHVVVMVRTDLATLHQTVFFKIPAALLPTVQYKITLNENDPSVVDAFTREGAEPMRLVFEVGVRSDINSVNMEQKIAEHIAKGGHVHRNSDGTVSLYTNEFAIGNDKNGNGIPDVDEVDSAIVAESHFHPAMDNSRFYYTEDTLILDASGNPVTGSARPTDLDGSNNNTTGYYYTRYIYSSSKRTAIQTPIAAATLANDAQYDTANNRWYIPAGTMYHNLARFKLDKTANATGTLGYSFFPTAFDGTGKQDVYTFLGNNGTITAAPATGIVLNKQLQEPIDGITQYTFCVTLSDTSVTPVLTDANGNALSGVTMSAVTNGQFTVTMPANVDAYISGIPANTNVTVEELIDGDYKVVGLKVAGVDQAVDAPASFTIPAYSVTGSQMVNVSFTNAPNGYGDLVITKDVHHELASDPEALATKEFTFQVTLTGEKLKSGNTFATSDAATTVQVTADGSVTFQVTLHDEESITIYQLPEDTAYEVKEISIPEGFYLTDASAASGKIAADQTITAGFVNTYPDEFHEVNIPLSVKVNKILNDPNSAYTAGEEFVFVLQALLSDGTYPNVKDVNGNEYLKVTANSSQTGNWDLKFSDIGTYYFRVVELKPSLQTPAGTDTPGMTYSTTRALFAVVVTDNDMDGNLEINVREEAHVDAAGTYTDSSDLESITAINVETTFTNTYELHSTSVSVNVHKNLVNNTGVDIPLTDFQFGLYAVDGEGNATGSAISSVTASALGDATFNIPIITNQDLTYIIKEIVPDPQRVGMQYSSAEYVLTIDVEADLSGQLSATTTLTLKGGSSTDVALFTNTYALAPVDVNVPVSKTFTGRELESGESFQAYLERTGDTFVPLASSDANAWSSTYTLPVNAGADNVKLTFTKAGTYHYRFTEVIPSDATTDPATGKLTKNGITYDSAEYHITITVSENGNGGLQAQTTIHKLGEAAPVNTVSFTNSYTVKGEGSVTIGGEKVLNGRALVAGEFTIGLYSDSACTDLIESTTNKADGTFSFSTIPYTTAHLGTDNAAKTYTYYVKETDDNKGGVSYDDNFYTVTVTVSHKNGQLVVTPSGNAATLKITNTYKADDVTATISGSKVLSGDWTYVSNKSFTFNLYRADASFNITNQTPVKTATVNGNDNFSISLKYEDGEEGYYYYVLKEVIPDPKAGGVGYDAGEYHITVNVTDPGEGKLVAHKTIYRPGTGNTETATFTNSYSVEPTTITLTGSKSYVNTATNQTLPMAEGDFTFLVLEGSDVVATGYNKTDGTIQFSEIKYTAAGVHTYKVVEETGEVGGVIYDENEFSVTVTVTDNGDGTLTAVADYNGKRVAFENKYTPEAAKVSLDGSKLFSGDWSKVTNKTFAFWLYETDNTFSTTGLTPVEQTNGTDGGFSFGTLTFTKEDTYYYYLVEKDAGKNDKGISYSDTYYKITIQVTDQGGKLIPSISIDTNNTAAPTVTANQTEAAVTGLNFTNTYTPGIVTYTPEAKKDYKGDQMKAFDFVLSGSGFATQNKQNALDTGKVVFDPLTFTEAGTYEITISEQKNALWGFIRWDVNVYKLTFEVIDDGAGQLHIQGPTVTSILGSNDLVFHNTHEDLITDKDVFLVGDPTVSIDGKKVQIGDELVYNISYTNYTGKVVNTVTITDTLPASLTYVEGSADKGGVYANGTVTWNLSNVPIGETVTVSFRSKVANASAPLTNTATVVDDENTYTTNEVTNPVTNDEIVKTVAHSAAPTVSIDGQKVAKGDELLYTITYRNLDDQAAKVTITDILSQYVVYVEGSADNGGVYANGTVAWTLDLAAGETKTVSFKAIVKDAGATIQNQAQAFDGVNKLSSNTVTTYTPAPPATPQTGDEMNLVLWLSLLLISAAGMVVLITNRKRIFR